MGQARSSPQVFLSYQWGKQPQVKALAQKLKERGFSCWLDIEQMSGGQRLLEKISHGIRGCEVLLACITTDYCKSENCRGEFMLAHSVKKPIIPLKLEKAMQWPPEAGGLEFVLAQLLYIDFCKPNEAVQDTWICPNFEELVKCIERHVTPRLLETPKQLATPTQATTPKRDKTPKQEWTPSDDDEPKKTTAERSARRNDDVPCPTLCFAKRIDIVDSVTSFKNQLFVMPYCGRYIEVYDLSSFELQRLIQIPDDNTIAYIYGSDLHGGLAVCLDNDCLYVSVTDRHEVYKVNPSAPDDSTTVWSVDVREPRGLSVTQFQNILVASCSGSKVLEYTTKAKLMREIFLEDVVGLLRCAVELNEHMLVVAYRKKDQYDFCVSIVTVEGEVLRSYPPKDDAASLSDSDEQGLHPWNLAVDKNGFILVTDEDNDRILVINPELTDARTLPLTLDTPLKKPTGLWFDESQGRLFVGESGHGENRALGFENVYNLHTLFKQ